jgi:curved DNA-binding protein CbpA
MLALHLGHNNYLWLRMKQIIAHRKLLGVTKTTTLKELKTIYRNLMKEIHPDTIGESEELKLVAEEKSKAIIEAYHFLVSISPETLATYSEEYKELTSKGSILDFEYKGQVLKITFTNGSAFEYFEVPRNTYIKLVNSDTQARFARRHIYNEFPYRKAGTVAVE